MRVFLPVLPNLPALNFFSVLLSVSQSSLAGNSTRTTLRYSREEESATSASLSL